MLAVLVVAAAWGAFSAMRHVQQRRLAAQARIDGLAAYRAGDLQRAITELSYYFEQRKDDLEVNLVFAEARSRLATPGGRHLFEAIDLYTSHCLELIDRLPDDHAAQRREILQRLLGLYAQVGDRLRVEQTADALLKIDPKMIDALAAKAEVLFLGRSFADAETLAAQLIELDPDNLTWRKMLLEVRARQGATSDALVQQCRQWAQQYSADARFRLLTAGMLVDSGKPEEARAELHGENLTANSRAVLDQLISLLDALGLRAGADAAVASAIEQFPAEWWPHEVSIRRLWQSDDAPRAIDEITAARTKLGEPPASVRRLEVVALISAGRNADAQKTLEPLLQSSAADKELDDDRAWATAVRAVLVSAPDKRRDAIDALQMALATSPHDPVLHLLLGDACMEVGEYPRAINAYQEAYSAAPNWIAAGVTCGNALLTVGRLDDAFQIARLVVTRSGGDRLQPFLLYARCFIALRESGVPVDLLAGGDISADLIAALQRVRQDRPHDAEVATLLARGHLAAGDQLAASGLMQQAIDDPQPDADVLLALAGVSRAAGLKLESPLLQRAQQISGLSIPVAFAQADLLAGDGKFPDGLRLIDQALSAGTPGDAQKRQARCARAAYLLRAGDASAMTSLAALIGEYENSAEVQRFALAQPRAWSDQRLVAQAMANLRRLLGENSLQVRLADANFLIQHHAREPAMLAKAIVAINSVLDEAPDSLAALSLAAEALVLGDRPNLERATAHLERAVGLYPGEPSLLARLIDLLQRQGRFDVARRYLQTFSQALRWHPELAEDELRLLQAQGDFESALVRAAALVNETSPPPQQLLLAAMEERAGHVDKAEEVYARLLAAHPDDSMVLSQAAEFYAATARFTHGLDLIQKLPIAPGGPSRELLVGLFYERHGRLPEADHWLHDAVQRDPKSLDARNALARHDLAIGEPLKAHDEAMAALRIDPSHGGLRATLAIANLALPNADRAEAIRLLREIGGASDALLAMLQLLEKVPVNDGRAAPTGDNLTAARQLTAQHALFLPVWQLAVSLHVEAGRRSDAIAIAREAVGRLPGEPQPAEWATTLLMQAGRWDEALAEAQEWRRRTLSDPIPADAAAARALIALNRAQDAVKLLQPHEAQLLEDHKSFPDRLATLVEALVRAGDVPHAEKIMTPLLSEDRGWRSTWIAAAALMDPANAERVLASIESLSQDPEERLSLATQWLALAQRTGSEAHLQQAQTLAEGLQQQPITGVGASITLGAVAEMRNDLPAAERHYRAALAAAPQNPVALNNLAFVLASQAHGEEALPFIEQALKLQPDQPDFLDTYSVTLKLVGRHAEAERAIRSALDRLPDDPGLMLTLADVQLALGARDDAAATVERIDRRAAGMNPRQRQRLEDVRHRLAETTASAPVAGGVPKPGSP